MITFQLEANTLHRLAEQYGRRQARGELKDGDKVTVEAEDIEAGKQPINAMMIKKAE